MQSMPRLLIACSIAASLAIGSPAFASDPQVEARFKRGVELFKEADFRAALVEFKRAYERSKNPKILFNIAQCEYQLTDYVAASATFEKYLKEGASVIDKARRAEVEEELLRLRSRIASLTVTANVTGAVVSIDDDVAGTLPLATPILLNPGTHRIVVRKDGYAEAMQKIDVAGGDTPTIQLHLDAIAVARPAPMTSPPPEAPSSGSALRTTGIVVGAAGLVTIGVGVVFGLSAKSKNDEAADMCAGLECRDPRALSLTDEAKTSATVSTVGFVAGGALLAGGVALYLLAPSAESKTSLRLVPRASANTAGLGLGGTFE